MINNKQRFFSRPVESSHVPIWTVYIINLYVHEMCKCIPNDLIVSLFSYCFQTRVATGKARKSTKNSIIRVTKYCIIPTSRIWTVTARLSVISIMRHHPSFCFRIGKKGLRTDNHFGVRGGGVRLFLVFTKTLHLTCFSRGLEMTGSHASVTTCAEIYRRVTHRRGDTCVRTVIINIYIYIYVCYIHQCSKMA